MNKNRWKALIVSFVISLSGLGGLAVPLVSAVTDPGAINKYLEVPINVTRNAPTFKDASGAGCLTPCKDIASGIGMYGYVSTDHKPETANFSNVIAIDTTNYDPKTGKPTTPIDTKDVSTVLNPDWAVVNGNLHVYGLTIGHSYKLEFTYEDAKSTDIQNFINTTKKYYCQSATFSQSATVPPSEKKSADLALHLLNGCARYDSEPFLPAAINPFIVNNDQPFKYSAAVTKLSPQSMQAPAPANPSVVKLDATDDCPLAAGAPMRWLGCPLIAIGASSVQALQGLIQQFLYTPVSQIFDNAGFKATATTFRIIGMAIILIAGLVMVISQALGMELFDAYTVRKILPRLVVALIGMALAWPILRLVVTFFNDLGLWSSSLIGAVPHVSTQAKDDGAIGGLLSSAFVIGGAAAALMTLGIGGILSLLGTLLLALLVGFIVLAIRQMVLLVVILMAPLAIAAYVLPGTQKLWNFWREALTTTLVMFPIIMIFLASGKALSTLLSATGSNSMVILAIFVYFAPFFLLPFAFKLAGGLMSTIFSIANDRGRGGFDRLKKYRQGQTQKRMGYYGQHAGDWAFQKRAEAVRNLNSQASRRGRLAGGAMRLAGRQIGGLGGIEPRMSAINARTAKEMNEQIATGMDGDIRGLTVDRSIGWTNAVARGLAQEKDGKRQWKSLGGAWVDESDVINGQKKWGHDVAAQQAALSYEMRKAMTDDEVAGISQRYSSLARNQWGQTETQAGGSWIGAGFENQNQHLEFKNTDWKTGQLNAEKFSKEVFEKKGTYQLSQMSAHTIEQLREAYDQDIGNYLPEGVTTQNATAEQIQKAQQGREATRERIQAVAESFMSRFGGGGGGVVTVEDGTPIVDNSPRGAMAGGGRSAYQTNSQGAAHVAQEVRKLAVHTGVYRDLPQETEIHSAQGPYKGPRLN